MNNRLRFVAISILAIVFMPLSASAVPPAFSATQRNQDQVPSLGDSILVVDQQGNPLNFRRDLIENKIFAINFIFTRCTASCPLSSAVFRAVQQQFREQSLELISITVDPTTDMPDRLRDYAKKFHGGSHWHFVTGKETVINELLKAVGVTSTAKESHTNLVLVGNDAKRQWIRLYGLPNAGDIIAALNDVR
jgi:protein SCO1